MRLAINLFLLVIQISFVWVALVYSRPADYSIIGEQSSVSVPFDLIDNRIFVNVEINGQGPFRFILDTGVNNIVSPEVFNQLKLKNEGFFQTYGVGEQNVQAWQTTIEKVQIAAALRSANQKFTVISLQPIKQAIGFKKFDGIIGFPLFSSFVTKIDYEQNILTFIKPSKFSYNGSGKAVPFEFAGHIPQVEAEVDGFIGKLLVDIGDRSSMTLFVPFVEKNHLRQKYNPPFKTITGWGIGGPVIAQMTRIKSVKLDGTEVQDIVTRLPVVKNGIFTDAGIMGSIGTGFIKRFNIVLDYDRKSLIFEKNKNFAYADIYDRAGMWIKQSDNVFEVMDIVPGAPAEKSGIKVGDKILAVDGKSSSELLLPEVRQLLKNPDSKEPIKLIVQSGNKSREVLVILEKII